MKSKWSHLKPEAIRLRKLGKSLPYVHQKLRIPKSTLSYWFKDIELTPKQQENLQNNWKNALVKARLEAVKWHNQQKNDRLLHAEKLANKTLSTIDTADKATLELALAVLYLAEGSKKNIETAMSSSDHNTLRFFLKGLEVIFDYEVETVRCELYLRADQNPDELKKYWAKELDLPMQNFKQVNVDKRSVGKKTYPDYHGVCALRCGNVAIRRRLVYLAEKYFAIIGQQK